jgi:1-acyl-sn-glycerol-3-phosphate acyltransferase
MVRYHFPLHFIIPRLPSFILGRRRSLSADVHAAFKMVGTLPHIKDAGHVPKHGPFLMVMNHFHREDIPSWWMAMAVMQAIAEQRAGYACGELRMVIASQWTYDGLRKLVAEPMSQFLIGRVIRVYHGLPMVPTALGQSASVQRAQTLRNIIEATREAARSETPIGLAPEGGDTPGGVMIRPPAGAGRFMQLLSSSGIPFLPAGAWADGDQIHVKFGEPFQLNGMEKLRKDAREEAVVQWVMGRIAVLVPERLRGPFGEIA